MTTTSPRGFSTAERRDKIAQLAIQIGSITTAELIQMFNVSEVTLRNDLEILSNQGILVRRRGGAIANSRTSLTISFEQRAGVNLDAKRRIGAAAAKLINPGETIILDSGTTVMEVAKNLSALSQTHPLNIVTNALNIATLVGAMPDVNVILVGGSLNQDTISTVGPLAEQQFSEIKVSKVFLGIHAIDLEAGLTDTSIEIAQAKRSMIRAAQKVILVADSSKWGCYAFAKIIPLSSVHTFITDTGLPEEARQAFYRLGIELILV